MTVLPDLSGLADRDERLCEVAADREAVESAIPQAEPLLEAAHARADARRAERARL